MEMMEQDLADRARDGARIQTWVLSAVGLIAGANVPAAVGVALLVSVGAHRPLLARVTRLRRGANATRLTIVWALALFAIAAVQGAGAALGMASITTLAGLVARAGFALAAEAVLLIATTVYLTAPTHRLGKGPWVRRSKGVSPLRPVVVEHSRLEAAQVSGMTGARAKSMTELTQSSGQRDRQEVERCER